MSMVDAASKLGVSTSLISMVLNDRWRENRISPETRQRVLKQLESIHFRPNRLARSLHNHRTGAIGVLIPNIRGEFYQSILNGIESVLGGNSLPLLGVSEYDPEKERRLIISFLEHRVDGLILVATGDKRIDPLLEEISRKGIPLVLVDRDHAKVSACFVGSDHREVGELAAAHLSDAGYSHCAFMSHAHAEAQFSTVAKTRFAGFEAVLRRRGVPLAEIEETISGDPPDFHAAGERFLDKALKQLGRPIGLFAMHPMAAAGVLSACRQKGLDIPRTIGLLTADGFPYNDLMAIPVSTIRQQTQRIGQIAAQLLQEMMQGRVPANFTRRVELEVELAVASSTLLRAAHQ